MSLSSLDCANIDAGSCRDLGDKSVKDQASNFPFYYLRTRRRSMHNFRLLAFPLVLLLSISCGGKRVVTDPAFQPEIINQTDNFAFQSTRVSNVTQTLQYTWQNTGTVANVNQATQITSGSATITIRDSAGLQVYTASLSSNGTFITSSGATGGWTIRLVLTNFNGTLNFRVQRNP
jgi:hypothetical protein